MAVEYSPDLPVAAWGRHQWCQGCPSLPYLARYERQIRTRPAARRKPVECGKPRQLRSLPLPARPLPVLPPHDGLCPDNHGLVLRVPLRKGPPSARIIAGEYPVDNPVDNPGYAWDSNRGEQRGTGTPWAGESPISLRPYWSYRQYFISITSFARDGDYVLWKRWWKTKCEKSWRIIQAGTVAVPAHFTAPRSTVRSRKIASRKCSNASRWSGLYRVCTAIIP